MLSQRRLKATRPYTDLERPLFFLLKSITSCALSHEAFLSLSHRRQSFLLTNICSAKRSVCLEQFESRSQLLPHFVILNWYVKLHVTYLHQLSSFIIKQWLLYSNGSCWTVKIPSSDLPLLHQVGRRCLRWRSQTRLVVELV